MWQGDAYANGNYGATPFAGLAMSGDANQMAGIGKLFKKVTKVVGKVAKVALPVAAIAAPFALPALAPVIGSSVLGGALTSSIGSKVVAGGLKIAAGKLSGGRTVAAPKTAGTTYRAGGMVPVQRVQAATATTPKVVGGVPVRPRDPRLDRIARINPGAKFRTIQAPAGYVPSRIAAAQQVSAGVSAVSLPPGAPQNVSFDWGGIIDRGLDWLGGIIGGNNNNNPAPAPQPNPNPGTGTGGMGAGTVLGIAAGVGVLAFLIAKK